MVAISYSLTLLKNIEFDLNRIVVHCLLVEAFVHMHYNAVWATTRNNMQLQGSRIVISHVFYMFVESLTTDTPYVATTSASSELLQYLRLWLDYNDQK